MTIEQVDGWVDFEAVESLLKEKNDRIAELEASCEQWARRVDELSAELDKARKDFGYEQQMRWHLRSELDTWMRKKTPNETWDRAEAEDERHARMSGPESVQ